MPEKLVSKTSTWMTARSFCRSFGIWQNVSKTLLHHGCSFWAYNRICSQPLPIVFVFTTELHTTVGGHRSDPKKVDYTFLGKSVGRSCLCTLLAIGKGRFSRCTSLKPDLRIGKSKSGSQRSSWSVDAFLSVLYNGVAETLPDKLLG